MLQVKDTPNHLGAYISGTFNDLEALYDAVYDVMGLEDAEESADDSLLRVCSVLYDIRHAYMGDREIKLCPNGVTDTSMAFDGKKLPEQNVVFSVPVPWINLADFALVTDDLTMVMLNPRAFRKMYKELPKEAYEEIQSRLESSVGLVKFFASLVWREMGHVIGSNRLKRIDRQDLYGRMLGLSKNLYGDIPIQYIDMLNARYYAKAPDKRPEILGRLVRYLISPYSDRKYDRFQNRLEDAAFQYGVDKRKIEFPDWQLPEDFEW